MSEHERDTPAPENAPVSDPATSGRGFHPGLLFVVALGVVVVVAMLGWTLMHTYGLLGFAEPRDGLAVEGPIGPGEFGDSFGVLTCTFSGIALVLMAITVRQQQEQVRQQQEQIDQARLDTKAIASTLKATTEANAIAAEANKNVIAAQSFSALLAAYEQVAIVLRTERSPFYNRHMSIMRECQAGLIQALKKTGVELGPQLQQIARDHSTEELQPSRDGAAD